MCMPTGFGEHPAETGSHANRGRADSGPEQHRRAGAEDQRPGQPDGGVCPRGTPQRGRGGLMVFVLIQSQIN